MKKELEEKKTKLERLLAELGGAVLAYSGGVDSSYLAAVASKAPGFRLLLVTATSPTYTLDELEQAKQLAEKLCARHIVVETDEFLNPEFTSNPPNRCYLCKGELFDKIEEIRVREGLPCIMDGSNADDTNDFRPGSRAAREHGVRSPLREAGLTKDDIRELSRELDLPTWDQPARACLASRFPYGSELTPDAMGRVAQAESFLYSNGFRMARVRSHGDTARIEVGAGEIARLVDPGIRPLIVEKFRAIGYTYVTADLQGYRTGSMNETLDADVRAGAEGKKS